MTKPPKSTHDIVLIRIIGNLFDYDGSAPVDTVSDTFAIRQDIVADTGKIVALPASLEMLSKAASSIRECKKRFKRFDSGAVALAESVAESIDVAARKRIAQVVAKALLVHPVPGSGLKDLRRSLEELKDAQERLTTLSPASAVHLGGLIAKYEASIAQLMRAATATAVIRKEPSAKKSVLI